MIGGNVTDYDYQVIDKDGNVKSYVWDDEERKMVEGNKHPIWSLGWRLEKIAKDLGGELKHYECSDRTSKHKKIVIEYDHEKK